MDQRKKIGILLLSPEMWTGGYYYSLNLVKCVSYLPEEQRPHLVIFYSDEKFLEEVKKNSYPYMSFLPVWKPLSFIDKVKYKLNFWFRKTHVFPAYKKDTVSFIYPFEPTTDQNFPSLRHLFKQYWIPDFQELYYPSFFSADDLEFRKNRAEFIVKHNSPITFSSQAVHDDFNKFYSPSKNRVSILSFASIVPDITGLDSAQVFEKYGIKGRYFIAPNQFWIHKNHNVVIDAVIELKRQGIECLLLFTGKESDYRQPQYTSDLKTKVEKSGVSDNIRFLGFIDREDQLLLMKHSIAVIQPSLFEGWSTVVEDTKAINHRLILSDIPVHKEQIKDNVCFFDPMDHKQLATLMAEHLTNPSPVVQNDYRGNIREFAKRMIEMN